VQFSVLSGRIFFKNFSYYSKNQYIQIVEGYVSFRYWLRRVRKEPLHPDDVYDESIPCRILLYAEGFEWCLFNRDYAYDEVEKQLYATNEQPPPQQQEPDTTPSVQVQTQGR
jgi:hypothetical protein